MAIEHRETTDIREEALRWVVENRGIRKEMIGKGYQSPRISSEIPDCSMPLSFDNLNFCSLGCLYCCLRGTEVLKGDGSTMPIEEINVGETVFSCDESTGKMESDDVVSFMARTINEVYDIELEDGTVVTLTGEHPVFVKNHGWVEVKNLVAGQEVVTI